MGGPMQKQIANAMPTCANAFERVAVEVTSERIALSGGVVSDNGFILATKHLHCQLHVSFTQTSYNSREQIRRKCCGLYPTNVNGLFIIGKLSKNGDVHNCGKDIANHRDEENAFPTILVRE